MTYAFISYKREDEVRVGRIAHALEQAGIEVWWDRGLPGGESWQQMIAEKLDAAGCVVVVWSFGSISPEGSYVRDEARHGLSRGALVPVIIDSVRTLPLGFGEVQAIDLIHWRGDARDPFFRDLVEAVRAKLDGVRSPPPRGPVARVRRRLFFGGVSATTLAVFLILAINAFGVTARVCTAPGLQPALADTCGALRIGGQPTRTQRLAWAALPKGNCQALRDFVRDYPDSPLRSRAADLITAGEKGGPWVPGMREMPLYFAASEGEPKATQVAEQSDALERARDDADAICRPLAAGTVFRYAPNTATAKVTKWSCDHTGAGYACSFSGWAECPVQSQSERCG
jgi:hypothetical protein